MRKERKKKKKLDAKLQNSARTKQEKLSEAMK